MSPQAALWTLAAASAALTIVAAFLDHRRGRRRDLDRVGWVPWALVQIIAMIGAVVAAVLALKG